MAVSGGILNWKRATERQSANKPAITFGHGMTAEGRYLNLEQLGLWCESPRRSASEELSLESALEYLVSALAELPEKDKINAINKAKLALHAVSPFNTEPVDCVIWVENTSVQANTWNPNKVAPVEMELLRHSILADGYTQPIVTFQTEDYREVVDGFHRNRVGKECEEVTKRVHGYLPVVTINDDRTDKNDRIASTIRHNRARGKHQVESMSDIVIELKKRNWSDAKICKELGMDDDEVLRLCQVSGLVEVFCDAEFSKAWDAEIFSEDDFDALSEEDIK